MIVAQVVFLLSILMTHYVTVWAGEEITLQSRPIDPYDPFRGAYVQLAYEQEIVPRHKVFIENPDYNQKVFVTFIKEGNHYVVDQVLSQVPEHALYLRATYRYRLGDDHLLDFNLGRYYTNEAEALYLEEMRGEGILVQVKIRRGRGIMTGIVAEGE
jgi:uncharacterized membrane-anchored protein